MTETGEIFPNAPLREVAYEVTFPTLFSIPQDIGAFQIRIMDDFPNSSLLTTTPLIIENGVTKLPVGDSEKTIRTWQFESETGKTKIAVQLNRLAISSQEYTSYDNPSRARFRDVIDKTITEFLKKVPIKKFTRIGLRYIDFCPLEEKTNQCFEKYYVPIFNIEKYKIDDIIESHLIISKKKEEHNITVQCGITKSKDATKSKDEYTYILDFDAYAENVDSANFLSVTDELRMLDRSEFHAIIKDDFVQHMRGVANAK